MGRRGPKPKGKVQTEWSADLAYAIGLLATDGCVSGDGRHILFVSKDLDQIKNFMKGLGIKIKIGNHVSGYKKTNQKYYRCQFGDVMFCNFLNEIGVTKAKSRTIGKLKIPEKYFFDFLRGCLDGDGYTYSYWDPRWKSSFMLYLGFVSASYDFISWIRSMIKSHLKISGHVTSAKKKNICYQLKYAKTESILVIKEIYRNKKGIYLKRKKLKINKSFGIMGLKAL